MKMPQELKRVWEARAQRAADLRQGWFVNQYEMAMARVENHREDSGPEKPYILAPSVQHTAIAGGVIYYDGESDSPDGARKQAFEMLVLADMAEVMLDAPSPHTNTANINGDEDGLAASSRALAFESLGSTEINYDRLNSEARILFSGAYSKGQQDAKTDTTKELARHYACNQMELVTVALASAINGEKPSVLPMANMARRLLNTCPLLDDRIQRVITLIAEANIDPARHRSLKRDKLEEAHKLSAEIFESLSSKR